MSVTTITIPTSGSPVPTVYKLNKTIGDLKSVLPGMFPCVNATVFNCDVGALVYDSESKSDENKTANAVRQTYTKNLPDDVNPIRGKVVLVQEDVSGNYCSLDKKSLVECEEGLRRTSRQVQEEEEIV